jgi:hypothetical protein
MGWSELAPTNAPVADELVEAVFWMDENPILPARFFFFFSTSSLPQNFPPSYLPPTSPRPTYHLPPPSYLPPTSPRPTYHLPPPSYLPPTTPTPPSLHRQSSRDLGRLWSGSWSCGYGAGAAGAGAELLELERDPRAHEKVRSLACLLVATQQVPERESLLLQHSKLRSLLQLNPAMQQALERLLQ